MAHLARCPRCYSELEIPAELMDGADHWATCPSCEETFAVRDAQAREIKAATAGQPPIEASQVEAADTTGELSADYGGATLASYLGKSDRPDDKMGREQPEADAPASKSSAATLSDLPSLEALFRGSGASQPQPILPQATVAGDAVADDAASDESDESDLDATGDGAEETAATSEPSEPSPAADRWRGSQLDSHSASGASESGEYDAIDEPEASLDELDTEPATPALGTLASETLDDFARLSPTEQPSREEVAATAADAPNFDFEVGGDFEVGDDPLGESKSLRASMGLASDEPLELHDEPDEPVGVLNAGEHSDEGEQLDFEAPETPRGVVASRKRSSSLSFVRTVLGVVFGGVLGIAGGYLILLWILDFRGVTDDPLSLAGYYPDVVKPESFQSTQSPPTQSPPAQSLPAQSPPAQSPPAQRPPAEQLASDENETPDGSDSVPPFEETGEVDQATYESNVAGEGDRVPEQWKFPASPAAEAEAAAIEIADAPSYTANQLAQLTAAAVEASPAMTAGGEIDKSKGTSYATLAKLADALTFAGDGVDANIKQQAREVFPPLFATDESRRQIAQIAGYWLPSPKRGHGGIFFSGRVDPGRQQGSVAEYNFSLRSGQQLTVLTPQPLAGSVTSSPAIVVVGSVINDPADRIPGYTGTATQAIWSTEVLPLIE